MCECMDHLLKCIVDITPVSWATPRVNFKSRFLYDSQKTIKKTHRAALQVLNGSTDHASIKNLSLHLRIVYHMGKPHKHKKYFNTKPDFSNMLKFTEDCFKGVLWEDDSRIVSIDGTQLYSEPPGYTEIDVYKYD